MVKVLEKSGDEREEERNIRTLVKITEEALKETPISDLEIVALNDSFGLVKEDSKAVVTVSLFFDEGHVDVYAPDYKDLAIKLAEKYEARLKQEFTVKLKY